MSFTPYGPPGPTLHLLLSKGFGYASIFCWIVVFLPQLYENYQNKSASSLSFYFILFWSLGDVFNLLGSIYQHLIFTAILLPTYFIFTDTLLLGQIAYYNYKEELNIQQVPSSSNEEVVETTPIIINQNNNQSDLVGSFSYNSIQEHQSPPAYQREQHSTSFKCIFPITLFILLILLINNKNESLLDIQQDIHPVWWAQLCGWISTFLFCLAKVPQIFKNYQRKSTQGLSMLMFTFCCLGNLTFILSITLYDNSKDYLFVNLPWLLGAALPFIFDFVIFGQYFAYRDNPPILD